MSEPSARADLINVAMDLATVDKACIIAVLGLMGLAEVAETFGQCERTAVLGAVTDRIMTILPNGSSVRLLGHDHIGVVVAVGGDLAKIASSLVSAVVLVACEPCECGDQVVVLHASAGLSLVTTPDPAAAVSAAEAMTHAELAADEAARRGPGSVVAYDDALARAAVDRLQITSRIGRAAALGELRLEFQSINELVSGQQVGAEALVRWQHPDLGLLWPGRFIPAAEQSAAIASIGRWVLEQACAEVVRWMALGGREHWQVHVNVSARQLDDLAFPAQVRDIVARSGIAPDRLVLELTETGIIADTEQVAESLAALKAVGVGLAIDDFGVGFSSLSYLTRLPVDSVKIDRAFISDLGVRPAAGELVCVIIDLATRLGLNVVAEGIETEEQRREVILRGGRLGQGYLFGRPRAAPVERIEPFEFPKSAAFASVQTATG